MTHQVRDERLLKLLNPEAAINFAYDLHVTQDPFASKDAKRISRRALEELHATTAESGPIEAAFLAQVYSVIVSHGNGLKNLKKQHHDEFKNAERIQERREEQQSLSQVISAGSRAMWKVAGTFAVGVIGYATTKSLALIGWVPDALVNQHGKTDTIVSLGVGAVFFAITGYLTTVWTTMNQNRIDKEHADLIQACHLRYGMSKQIELDANWEKLCALWRDFTGSDWRAMPAYMRVMKADLDFTLKQTELLDRTAQSTLGQMLSLIGQQVKSLKNRAKKRTAAATV